MEKELPWDRRIFAETVVERFFLIVSCFMWRSSSFFLLPFASPAVALGSLAPGACCCCSPCSLGLPQLWQPEAFAYQAGLELPWPAVICLSTRAWCAVLSPLFWRERYRTSVRKVLVPDIVGGSRLLCDWSRLAGKVTVVERKSLVIFHAIYFLLYVSITLSEEWRLLHKFLLRRIPHCVEERLGGLLASLAPLDIRTWSNHWQWVSCVAEDDKVEIINQSGLLNCEQLSVT